MTFSSKELSQRLQAMGCKSESSYIFKFYNGHFYPFHDGYDPEGHNIGITGVGCFISQDFIGPSEQARENARIVFGDDIIPSIMMNSLCPFCGKTCSYKQFHKSRHILIDLPEAEFWPYIEAALGENPKGL